MSHVRFEWVFCCCFLLWILVMFVWYFPATIVTNCTKGSRQFQRIYYHDGIVCNGVNGIQYMIYQHTKKSIENSHSHTNNVDPFFTARLTLNKLLWSHENRPKTNLNFAFYVFFLFFNVSQSCTNISFRSFYIAIFSSTYLYTLTKQLFVVCYFNSV